MQFVKKRNHLRENGACPSPLCRQKARWSCSWNHHQTAARPKSRQHQNPYTDNRSWKVDPLFGPEPTTELISPLSKNYWKRAVCVSGPVLRERREVVSWRKDAKQVKRRETKKHMFGTTKRATTKKRRARNHGTLGHQPVARINTLSVFEFKPFGFGKKEEK